MNRNATTDNLHLMKRHATPIAMNTSNGPGDLAMQTGMRRRVLIIDDDPIHLEVARAMMVARGFEVTVISTSTEAKSSDLAADVLLLDLNMPTFDGVEFLQMLKEKNYAGGIIIVSAAMKSVRAGAALLAKAYGLLLLGMIEKPLTAAALDAILVPQKM